jgi:hypothetical protein
MHNSNPISKVCLGSNKDVSGQNPDTSCSGKWAVKLNNYAVRLYCLQNKRTPLATNCYEIRSCSIHGERDWEVPLTPVIKGSAPFPSMGNVIGKDHCPVLF